MIVQPTDPALVVQPRFDAVESISSTTSQRSIVDADAQAVIKILHTRKGYSNPGPSSDDEDDAQNVVVSKPKRTRRPLRLISKDFNPYQSYTFKHANGTLTYVFPTSGISSTTISATHRLGGKSNPTAVMNREVSVEPLEAYPADIIDEIMNEHIARFEGAFGNDMINGDKLNSRFHISNEQFFCDIDEMLIHPSVGYTVKNSSVHIVNTKNFKQGVRIEKCRDEGKPCKFCDENTVCKQLYHYRTLVAVNLDSRKPYKELIQLPSCCKCARIPY